MRFDLEVCAFRLAARGVIRFPSGMAGNVLRGALGKRLREIASAEDYERIFAPQAGATGPSGLMDRPRPFVLRCASLSGRVIEPGETFCFGLHLFDTREPALDLITRAFDQWAGVTALEHHRISVDFTASRPASSIRVDFQTPAELKAKGQPADSDFSVLLARVRDRVSTLRSLYGAGPLEIDFRGVAERARLVKTVRSDLRTVALERRSSRNGQRHSIGGLVGFVEYTGDLAEFMPYLEAAQWTGVGRHCTWGNGHITTTIIA